MKESGKMWYHKFIAHNYVKKKTVIEKNARKERQCLVYVSQFWVYILQLWDIIVRKKKKTELQGKGQNSVFIFLF